MNEPHLQALLADLDFLLDHLNSSSSARQQANLAQTIATRQVLERVHDYLTALALTPDSTPLHSHNTSEITPIVEAVMKQINHRLGDWFNSLQTELAELRQQRQSLQQEVKNIQQQHQQMMSELMQTLMLNYQQSLEEKIQQVGETIAQQLSDQSVVKPYNQEQNLSKIQEQSSQLLQNLDSSLQTVFDNLEQDIQSYYDSLSQGLERMHSLGQQSEARLIAFLNRFAQKLEKSVTVSPHALTDVPQENYISESQSENTLKSETINKIHKLTDLIFVANTPQQIYPQGWYLSLDLGSFSLRAVLSRFTMTDNQEIVVDQYPLYSSSSQGFNFRFPIPFYNCDNENISLGLSPLKLLLNEPESEDNKLQDLLTKLLNHFILNDSNVPILKAPELSNSTLEEALKQLEGIIINLPSQGTENYRYHWLSALLSLNLFPLGTNIYFLEETIAILLAHLPSTTPLETLPVMTPTLVINSGFLSTDLALVKLPSQLQSLNYRDFSLASLAYGSQALEQDIFCQLIYPQWLSHLHPCLPKFQDLIPEVAFPDSQKRIELNKFFHNHPLGFSCLEAAKLAKLILQQQKSFSSEIMNQTWGLQRYQIKEQIIAPFLAQIEAKIDILLLQQHLAKLEIKQVILHGDTTNAIDYVLYSWIREQFPHAEIKQDSVTQKPLTVARGLARLPLFSLVRKYDQEQKLTNVNSG